MKRGIIVGFILAFVVLLGYNTIADTSWLNPVIGNILYKDVPTPVTGVSGYYAPAVVDVGRQYKVAYNESYTDQDVYFIMIEPDEHLAVDGETAEYVVVKQLDMLWTSSVRSGTAIVRYGVITAVDGTSSDICWGFVSYLGGSTIGRDKQDMLGVGVSFELDGATATWVDCQTKSENNVNFQTDVQAISMDPSFSAAYPAVGDFVGMIDEIQDGATFNIYYNIVMGYGH